MTLYYIHTVWVADVNLLSKTPIEWLIDWANCHVTLMYRLRTLTERQGGLCTAQFTPVSTGSETTSVAASYSATHSHCGSQRIREVDPWSVPVQTDVSIANSAKRRMLDVRRQHERAWWSCWQYSAIQWTYSDVAVAVHRSTIIYQRQSQPRIHSTPLHQSHNVGR